MTGLIGSFGNAHPAQATRLKHPLSPFSWLSHSKVEMVFLLPIPGNWEHQKGLMGSRVRAPCEPGSTSWLPGIIPSSTAKCTSPPHDTCLSGGYTPFYRKGSGGSERGHDTVGLLSPLASSAWLFPAPSWLLLILLRGPEVREKPDARWGLRRFVWPGSAHQVQKLS